MSQAVLITAYKDIGQLIKLIDKVRVFWVYVHIDRKARVLYKQLRKVYVEDSHVKIVSKYSVKWGSYNHLRAIVYMMGLAILNSEVKYVHVISGQDYPVADVKRFAEFETCTKVYMTCKRVMETNCGVKRRYFFKHIFAPIFDCRGKLYKIIDKHFACDCDSIGLFKVSDLYKGMIWASMPMQICIYVCMYVCMCVVVTGNVFIKG